MKMTFTVRALAIAGFLLITSALHAQVPQIINYQGRVAVGSTNFNGTGSFKFALVNAAGTTTFWSNDGTSTSGSQPTAAVSLTVAKGLYSALLGDTTLPNMTAIPNSVFNNVDVRLRLWFNDGTNGSQLFTPDQRLASVGYAAGTRIEDNHMTSHDTGIIVTGGSCFVLRNSVQGCAVSFTLTGIGTYGPIQSASGTAMDHPWTNFEE